MAKTTVDNLALPDTPAPSPELPSSVERLIDQISDLRHRVTMVREKVRVVGDGIKGMEDSSVKADQSSYDESVLGHLGNLSAAVAALEDEIGRLW